MTIAGSSSCALNSLHYSVSYYVQFTNANCSVDVEGARVKKTEFSILRYDENMYHVK